MEPLAALTYTYAYLSKKLPGSMAVSKRLPGGTWTKIGALEKNQHWDTWTKVVKNDLTNILLEGMCFPEIVFSLEEEI